MPQRQTSAVIYLDGLNITQTLTTILTTNATQNSVSCTIDVPYTHFNGKFNYYLNDTYTHYNDLGKTAADLVPYIAFQIQNSPPWLGTGSSIDMTTATINHGADAYGQNVADATQTLGDHFAKYIATALFGTWKGISLINNIDDFNNTVKNDINSALTSNMNTSFFSENSNVASDNLAGQLFALLAQKDELFWTTRGGGTVGSGAQTGYTVYSIPFMAGDKLYFIVDIAPNGNQGNSSTTTAIPAKQYIICMNLVA
jgi:hypothetical protein